MLGAPQPRFRIYTKPSSYIRSLGEIFTLTATHNEIDVIETESKLAQLMGKKHALLTPTCRTGIFLTLSTLIKPGQKVLLSPITIVEVINMVLCAGGIPVFLDVEENTCNIDPAEVEKNLGPDVGAVLITHLHGLACDVERIKKACDEHQVPLIEDTAQAFSTKIGNRFAGTIGMAGVFSFGLYKNVNSFFGGMIVTDDNDLAMTIVDRRNSMPYQKIGPLLNKIIFGLATDISTMPMPFSLFTYWFFRYGYLNQVDAINNMVTVDRYPKRYDAIPEHLACQITPLQARLVRSQLKFVEDNNQERIKNAALYYEGLNDIPDLILPPHRTDGSHIYTYFPVRFPDRHAFMRFAMEKRRDFVLSHYHNCAGLDIFKDFYRNCPIADQTANQLVYLPTYPRYRKSQINKNISVIREFFKK